MRVGAPCDDERQYVRQVYSLCNPCMHAYNAPATLQLARGREKAIALFRRVAQEGLTTGFASAVRQAGRPTTTVSGRRVFHTTRGRASFLLPLLLYDRRHLCTARWLASPTTRPPRASLREIQSFPSFFLCFLADHKSARSSTLIYPPPLSFPSFRVILQVCALLLFFFFLSFLLTFSSHRVLSREYAYALLSAAASCAGLPA